MPELPEVETVRRGLKPAMAGAKLVEVEARRPDLRFPLPEDFAGRLAGRTVRAHRFASEVLGGEECPPEHDRDHKCCFSLCVNRDHIEVVHKRINQERKVARRRELREQAEIGLNNG